jgi:hypothetical protein
MIAPSVRKPPDRNPTHRRCDMSAQSQDQVKSEAGSLILNGDGKATANPVTEDRVVAVLRGAGLTKANAEQEAAVIVADYADATPGVKSAISKRIARLEEEQAADSDDDSGSDD